MGIALEQILGLVGKLDDSVGEETPRERFRRFLRENVTEVGQIRDYIEECLRRGDRQYSRALQDLVNHLGHFLGFEVTFGRYQGVPGDVGFDGHWKSPTGFHIVVEIKTTEVYPIKTATLVSYVDELISAKKIPSWNHTLGLYVIGRPDPEIRQLENAILAENRIHQLRLISVNALLSLAELISEYDVSHEDILTVLRPSGPKVDPIVDLMTRLVAERQCEELPKEHIENSEPLVQGEVAYWITSVKSNEEQTAEEIIQTLVGQEQIYAFGDRTPGRRYIKPGDWICFYAAANGVVAHAKVRSFPEEKFHPKVPDPQKYRWVFLVDDVQLYLDNPVVIDIAVRKQLDAFQGRDLNASWAWFVQATRRISEHDFNVLTRGGGPKGK